LPPLYFLRTWSGICHKTNKNYFTYLPLHQNNNGTGQRLANKGALVLKKALYDENENLILVKVKKKNRTWFSVNWFYKQEILKNITLENRLSLYSDYINKFGNIDIDYDLTLELVVNEYVKLI
jgi:hypothetical protein